MSKIGREMLKSIINKFWRILFVIIINEPLKPLYVVKNLPSMKNLLGNIFELT